jgi:hypothetical protein
MSPEETFARVVRTQRLAAIKEKRAEIAEVEAMLASAPPESEWTPIQRRSVEQYRQHVTDWKRQIVELEAKLAETEG